MKKLCAVFLLAILVVTIAALPVFAIENKAIDAYDFSLSSAVDNKTLDSAMALELLLGYSLSDVEYDYINRHTGFSIKYNDGITTALIVCEHNPATNVLTVSAKEYVYKGKNGATVCWIPKSATFGQTKVDLNSDGEFYSGVFGNVNEDDSAVVVVDYEFSFTVSKDAVNNLLNLAYNDAVSFADTIAEKEREYQSLKDQYDNDLASYEDYLERLSEYESDMSAYTAYLLEKKIYEDSLREYNDYLFAMEDYNTAKEAHDNYQAELEKYNTAYAQYRNYLSLLDDYLKKNEKYNEYLAKIELINNQLQALDAAYVGMTDGRQLYSAVMGDLVTRVLEDQDLITSELVDASEEAIELAGECTELLRSILTEYKKRTTVADKYFYYTENYEQIRYSFTGLLKSLDNLYRNKRVRGALIAEEKDKKYIILVSQLYLISKALNDETIYSFDGSYAFDDSYKIEKQTPKQILENKTYLVDTDNAAPLAEGYPQEVFKPTEPTAVIEPQKPVSVPNPTLPDFVENPGDGPVAIEKPEEPDLVLHPGDAPVPYSPDEEMLLMVEALNEEKLYYRTPFDGDITATVGQSVTKKLFNVSEVNVYFLDENGEELFETTVDSGTRATYLGVLPEKAEDEYAIYLFSGWQDSEGTVRDLSSVFEDMILYPYFKAIKKCNVSFYNDTGDFLYSTIVLEGNSVEYVGAIPTRPSTVSHSFTFCGWQNAEGQPVDLSHINDDVMLSPRFDALLREYKIDFIVNGSSFSATVKYGETPVCPITPEKPDDEYYSYSFDGWNKDVTPVTGNEVYIANFLSEYIFPCGNDGGRVTSDENYVIAESLAFAENLNLSKLIDKAVSGGKGIKIKTGDYSYTVSYTTALSMKENGVASLDLVRTPLEYGYSVELLAKTRSRSVAQSYRVALSYKSSVDMTNYRLSYLNADGEKSYYAFTCVDGIVSFTANTETCYVFRPEYNLNVIPSDMVSIDLSSGLVEVGQTVSFDLTHLPGIIIDRVYYVSDDGVEYDVEGSSFVMPDSNVSVCVVASYAEYEIVFVTGHRVIAKYTYKYGETVKLPANPQKLPDGEYTYVFSGWSPSVDVVTGDVTYTATYDAVPIEPQIKDDGFHVSDTVRKYLIAAAVAIALIVVAVIPGAIIFTVCRIRAKRMRIKRQKNK